MIEIELDDLALADVECIGAGVYAPLSGFLAEADYARCLDEMRLSDGTPWPLPITLSVREPPDAERVALCRSGRLVATMEITGAYRPDKRREALALYGAAERSHPGVAALRESGPVYLAGPVTLEAPPRQTAAETRAEFVRRGWRTVVSAARPDPLLLDLADGVFLEAEGGLPPERVVLQRFRLPGRHAKPREMLLRAIASRNCGCTHMAADGGVIPLPARGQAEAPVLPVGRGGAIIWFTGLSASGKSTLARRAEERLRKLGFRVEVLDGDVVRQSLTRGLGFSKEDRDENIRRIGFVAHLLARNGVMAIVAAISPYRAIRDEVRARGGDFIEVYVNAPLAVCERRDPKGLYQKARAGQITGFTGIDDPYEPPLAPEVECRTDIETVEESTDKIIAALLR